MMIAALWKRLFASFKQFLEQITKDAMLFLACLAPILCGFLIKFGVPFAEELLTKQFKVTEILGPYYLIFDLFLAVLTPMMFCFVAAMVILGEIDDKISNYMAVTPLGKNGYLISRLGFPMMISFVVTMGVLFAFSLSNPTIVIIIGVSVLSAVLGLIMSMMVVAISTNKVEGMAVTKLTGIFIFGIPVPFFITGNVQYIVSILPSFWLSKFVIEENILYFILSLLISIGWMGILYKKFIRKML
jgi:fluoroquinolone transport system permease protein